MVDGANNHDRRLIMPGPLTQFAVETVPDTRPIRVVTDVRLFETDFASPQPFLPDLGDVEWQLAVRVREYALRRKRVVVGKQERLFPVDVGASSQSKGRPANGPPLVPGWGNRPTSRQRGTSVAQHARGWRSTREGGAARARVACQGVDAVQGRP